MSLDTASTTQIDYGILEKQRDEALQKVAQLEHEVQKLAQANSDLETKCEYIELHHKEEQEKVERMIQAFESQVDEEDRVKRELAQHFKNLATTLNETNLKLKSSENMVVFLENSVNALRLDLDKEREISTDRLTKYDMLKSTSRTTEERLIRLEKQFADNILQSKSAPESQGTGDEKTDDLFNVLNHYLERLVELETRCAELDRKEKQLNDSNESHSHSSSPPSSVPEKTSAADAAEIDQWKTRCESLEKILASTQADRDRLTQELKTARSDSPRTPIPTPFSSPTGKYRSPFRDAVLGCVIDTQQDDTPLARFRSMHSSVEEVDSSTQGKAGFPSE